MIENYSKNTIAQKIINELNTDISEFSETSITFIRSNGDNVIITYSDDGFSVDTFNDTITSDDTVDTKTYRG